MAHSAVVDLEDEYLELPEDGEEGFIRCYFFRGFEFEEIRLFLQKKTQNMQMRSTTDVKCMK